MCKKLSEISENCSLHHCSLLLCSFVLFSHYPSSSHPVLFYLILYKRKKKKENSRRKREKKQEMNQRKNVRSVQSSFWSLALKIQTRQLKKTNACFSSKWRRFFCFHTTSSVGMALDGTCNSSHSERKVRDSESERMVFKGRVRNKITKRK